MFSGLITINGLIVSKGHIPYGQKEIARADGALVSFTLDLRPRSKNPVMFLDAMTTITAPDKNV